MSTNRLFLVPPEPLEGNSAKLEELKRRISEVHNATCNGFATLGLPLKLRLLVCAIIAASNGVTKFPASYQTLVKLLFREGDGRTYEAKKSEVRRLIKGLRGWQEKTKITLCTITQGGKTKDEKGDDEYHDTEFNLVLLDAIAKALIQEPQPGKMRATVQQEIAEMMKLPPFDGRWAVKSPTLEQMQERDEKASVTMALKACEAEEKLHGDPLAYAKRLAAKIVATAREKFAQTPPQEGVVAQPSVETEEFEQGGGVSDPTHPLPLPDESEEAEIAPINTVINTVLIRNAEAAEQEDSSPPCALPSSPSAGEVPSEPDQLRAITAFESVGASAFQVLLLDDSAEMNRCRGDETVTPDSFRTHAAEFLKTNASQHWSLSVRPLRADGRWSWIQIDDAPAAVVERLRPYAFMIVETSPGNYQVWIAVEPIASEEAFKSLRDRLLRKLKQTGANGGAYGAVRWPGSLNCKPKRQREDGTFPQVRIVQVALGRFTTKKQLHGAGLLAPYVPPPPISGLSTRRGSDRVPSVWPDYEAELRAARKDDGKPDRSKADIRWAIKCLREGWSESEVAARLSTLSGKAKGRRDRYAEKTVRKAARIVAT